MRIAYLSYSCVPSREANSVHVMRMCAAFAREGHAVTLYAREGGAQTDDVFGYYGVAPAFPIVRHPRRDDGLGAARYGFAVRRAVRASDAELCFARDLWSAAFCVRMGRPLIYESHNPPRGPVGVWLHRSLFASPGFRRLVVISHALGEEYALRFPTLDPDRVRVAPDGADLPAAGAVPIAPQPRERLRVGYVGHLYAGRGVEIIVALARRLPDLDFELVGGTEEDLARWRSRVPELPNLRFHGFVPPARAEAVRGEMDVCLAPYQERVETAGSGPETARWMSPLKIFEYMASHKPVIASDLPVLREVLEDGVNALLVPPADVEAWTAAVRRLAADPALRRRLADRAHQDVATRFTWDARARRVLEGVTP
jgi:glycosyltransferase involved in cell wall biosynthesis